MTLNTVKTQIYYKQRKMQNLLYFANEAQLSCLTEIYSLQCERLEQLLQLLEICEKLLNNFDNGLFADYVTLKQELQKTAYFIKIKNCTEVIEKELFIHNG